MKILSFLEPDCLFIRIPKTGSTSIIEGLLGGRNNAACVYNGEMPEDVSNRFVFTFVRHPLDRLMSAIKMFSTYPTDTGEEELFRQNITVETVLDIVENENIDLYEKSYFSKLRLHTIPATSTIDHIKSVDFIGRFENFPEDYSKAAKALGVCSNRIQHLRKQTDKQDWKNLDRTSLNRALNLYKTDFDQFSYERPQL